MTYHDQRTSPCSLPERPLILQVSSLTSVLWSIKVLRVPDAVDAVARVCASTEDELDVYGGERGGGCHKIGDANDTKSNWKIT